MRTIRGKGDTAKHLAEKIPTQKKSQAEGGLCRKKEMVPLWRKEPSVGAGPKAGAKPTEVQDFRAASAPAVPTAGCSRAAGPRSPRGLDQHQTLPPRQGDAFALLGPICLDSIFFKVSEGKPGFFFSSSLRFFFFPAGKLPLRAEQGGKS